MFFSGERDGKYNSDMVAGLEVKKHIMTVVDPISRARL
jgi:hypothetical protein